MGNPQLDILEHRTTAAAAGKKAAAAITACCKLLQHGRVKQFHLWKEDYDAICKTLRDHNHRHDGFYIAGIKAVPYQERN